MWQPAQSGSIRVMSARVEDTVPKSRKRCKLYGLDPRRRPNHTGEIEMRWLFVLCLLVGAADARDLNRQPYPIGERASGMGGAFIAMTGDGVSTYYNPAGLATISAPGISLSASAYQYATETYADELEFGAGEGAFSADLESATFSTFPASIVFAVPLGDGAFKQAAAFSILVPDRDQLAARLNATPNDFAFEVQAVVLQDDLTYWVGPSYAFETGKLRVGLSVFALVNQTKQQANVASKAAFLAGDGVPQIAYITAVQELSALAATAVAQVGVQYLIDDHWTFGATVRSPTFGSIYSHVEGVAFNSSYAEDAAGNPRVSADQPAYVDRLELKSADAQFKLPLMVGVGVSYQQPARYTVALDASVHLAQPRYLQVDAEPNAPPTVNGAPALDRAFEPDLAHEAKLVWNVNLGGEIVLDPKWSLRGGAFTDRTTVDLDFFDGRRLDGLTTPAIDRYGVALAVGKRGKQNTSSVGLAYTFGTGEAWSLSEAFTNTPSRAEVTSHLITAMLSGSADF